MNEFTLSEFQAVCENAPGVSGGIAKYKINKSLLLRELNSIVGILHAVKGGCQQKHLLPHSSSESIERQRKLVT